jgi:integrase/recombinase XerD
MALPRSGVDASVIALWLGHEDSRATQAYIHADLEMKERALARTTPPDVPPGRYKAPDPLLAYLEEPVIMPDTISATPGAHEYPAAGSA